MDISEQIEVLKGAAGDPIKLAWASIDLAMPAMASTDREDIKNAFRAAAIPHWFHGEILAALLDVSPTEASGLIKNLGQLHAVESFAARGEESHNVHEATRLAVRSEMAKSDGDLFRQLSKRCADYFADHEEFASQIERVYHLLVADSEAAAVQLEIFRRELPVRARPEDRTALARALGELQDADLVHGRAHAWSIITRTDCALDEAAPTKLAHADRALELASEHRDVRAQAAAHYVRANALTSLGNLSEAYKSAITCLQRREEIAEEAPDNPGYQVDLIRAVRLVGTVLQERGSLPQALKFFQRQLDLALRACELDCSSPGSRYNVGLAHSHVAGVSIDLGMAQESIDHYGQYQEIVEGLIRDDPQNSSWQGEMGKAHLRTGIALE